MIAKIALRSLIIVIQICAKYGLFDLAQYVPAANDAAVAIHSMMLTGMNWRTRYHVFFSHGGLFPAYCPLSKAPSPNNSLKPYRLART